MITQQLLDFIKQQQAAGKSKEEITQALKNQGWQEPDINEGFAAVASGAPAPVSPATGPAGLLPKAQDIFKQAWEVYKQHWGKLLSIYIIPYLAIVALGALTAALAGAAYVGGVALHIPSSPVLIILVLALIVAAIYIGVWSEAALIVYLRDNQENISFTEAYKRSSKKIGNLFVVNLLAGLAIMGGFILLIIPGLVFAVWFSQSSYVAVIEDAKGTAALSKSKQYIQGRFWPVVLKLLYILAISILLSLILGFLGNLIFGNQESVIKSVINGLFNVLWAPLAVAYSYFLYTHIKSTAK